MAGETRSLPEAGVDLLDAYVIAEGEVAPRSPGA